MRALSETKILSPVWGLGMHRQKQAKKKVVPRHATVAKARAQVDETH